MDTKATSGTRASIALLLSLISAYTFIYLTKTCFSSAMVFIVEEGILTKFQTGTINAVFYAVYAVAQMAIAPIVDKFKPERFITVGLAGAAIANFAIYLNQNYVLILCVWVFNAIIQCAVWPAVFKISTMAVNPKMVGGAMFFINAAGTFGIILSLLVAATVGSAWQLNFLVSAIGLLAFAIIWEISCIFFRPLLALAAPEPKKKENKKAKKVKEKKSMKLSTFMFSSGLIMLFVIAIMRCSLTTGIMSLTPSLINESYAEVSARFSTIVSIAVNTAGFLGMLFASLLYPRFIQNEALAILILVSLTFPFVCFLLLVGKIHYLFIVLFLAMIYFLLSATGLFAMSYIAGRFNKFNMGATVVGFLNGGSAFGMVAANLVYTAIADNFGWYATMITWIVVTALVVLMAAAIYIVWTRFLKKIRKGEIYAENN